MSSLNLAYDLHLEESAITEVAGSKVFCYMEIEGAARKVRELLESVTQLGLQLDGRMHNGEVQKSFGKVR